MPYLSRLAAAFAALAIATVAGQTESPTLNPTTPMLVSNNGHLILETDNNLALLRSNATDAGIPIATTADVAALSSQVAAMMALFSTGVAADASALSTGVAANASALSTGVAANLDARVSALSTGVAANASALSTGVAANLDARVSALSTVVAASQGQLRDQITARIGQLDTSFEGLSNGLNGVGLFFSGDGSDARPGRGCQQIFTTHPALRSGGRQTFKVMSSSTISFETISMKCNPTMDSRVFAARSGLTHWFRAEDFDHVDQTWKSVNPAVLYSHQSNAGDMPTLTTEVTVSGTPLVVKVGSPMTRPLVPLSGNYNSNSARNLQACVNECDNNGHCATGLLCFQRGSGEAIPGCSGNGNGNDWDYCYDPNFDDPSNDGADTVSLLGDTGTHKLRFNGLVGTTWTLCTTSRYSTMGTRNDRGRIFDGVTTNWLHGHWGQRTQVGHYNGWAFSSRRGNSHDWVVLCSKNSGSRNSYANGQSYHGKMSTGQARTSRNLDIGIGTGRFSRERSQYAVHEVMAWNRALSDGESRQMVAYLEARVAGTI